MAPGGASAKRSGNGRSDVESIAALDELDKEETPTPAQMDNSILMLASVERKVERTYKGIRT
jgi:hypothetical protein